MDYRDYIAKIEAAAGDAAEVSIYDEVVEDARAYPLLRIQAPGPNELVVTSGFHGEEPAGPLTLADHLGDVLAAARRAGVGIRIYPCVNPSGFERGTRYNASGEKPNNDFLRYEIAPGVLADTLDARQAFLRWQLYDGGPKETRALRAELARHPPPAAALDVHQDDYLAHPLMYAYTFGDPAHYRPLVHASGAHVAVAREFQVDDAHRTDADGLIVFHDGSVSDYFYRLGVPYIATLETTTRTPKPQADAVNLIWIEGFIGLAAGRR